MEAGWFKDENGVLKVVRVAAYFPTKLSKKLVDQTNVALSVDRILLEQVPRKTQGVLGCLLLGVVRIYSKQVQYVCDSCEYLKVKLNEFVGRERTNSSNEAIHTTYFSITMPSTFQLDAFDLQISEKRTNAHIRSNEDIVLKVTGKESVCRSHFLDKSYSPEDGLRFQSAVLTPLEEENEMMASRFCFSTIEASKERLRDYSFSLEECLNSDIPGLVAQEPQLNNEEMRVSNDETFTAAEDDENEQMDKVEKIIEMESLQSTPNNVASTAIDVTPRSKRTSSSDTPEQAFMTDQTLSANDESFVEVDEGSTADVSHNEDKSMDTPQMVSPQSMKSNQASLTIDVTPISKGPNASGTPMSAYTTVPTPATRESGISRKRKRYPTDDITVLPNSVMKQNIADASDLKRERRIGPHKRLQVWKIQKTSDFPHNLFEPLIPCSSKIGTVLKKIQVVEATAAPDNTSLSKYPVDHLSPDLKLNIPESPVTHSSPDQADIAPSTPVSHSTSSKLYDGSWKNTYSDVEEEHDHYTGTDNGLMNENIDSPIVDGLEMDKWSVQTRAVASCLCKIFSSQRKHKQEESANLFHIVKGKNKSDSARMFYEILVLKSGCYVDVKQQAAYEYILVTGTPKLKKYEGF